jgi:hypothetical protein
MKRQQQHSTSEHDWKWSHQECCDVKLSEVKLQVTVAVMWSYQETNHSNAPVSNSSASKGMEHFVLLWKL